MFLPEQYTYCKYVEITSMSQISVTIKSFQLLSNKCADCVVYENTFQLYCLYWCFHFGKSIVKFSWSACYDMNIFTLPSSHICGIA